MINPHTQAAIDCELAAIRHYEEILWKDVDPQTEAPLTAAQRTDLHARIGRAWLRAKKLGAEVAA